MRRVWDTTIRMFPSWKLTIFCVSGSHYHHCMLNGTHIRRTCMAPLQFSEERQMCGEPGTVDCPDLPDFWLAAGAAAVVASGSPAPGSANNLPPSSSNTNPNAIVPASSNANNMAPFSNAPAHQANPSNNPFLAHSVTFNSAPHPPHPAAGGSSTAALTPQASSGSPAWGNPFSRHPPLTSDHPPSSSGGPTLNGVLLDRPTIASSAGGFSASRSSPADRDPFHTNDPPSVITTHSNRRPMAGGTIGAAIGTAHHHPSSPLRAAPTDNGQMHGLSTSGHLQVHPNLPQPVWLDTSASSQLDSGHPAAPRYFPRHTSLYQVRQVAGGGHPGPNGADQGLPSPIHGGSSLPVSGQSAGPANAVSDASGSAHVMSLYTSLGGRSPLQEHVTGLLTTGPETPPDAVLDQMAMNDPGLSSSVVQKVISNLVKAEASLTPVLSAALQMQKEGTTCAPEQKGFFADQANHCRSYYFCSPFGDRAEFNCPAGRYFSEKTVSCEPMEQSSCSAPSPLSGQHTHLRTLDTSSAVAQQGQHDSQATTHLQQHMNAMSPNGKPVMLRSSLPAYEPSQHAVAGVDMDLLAHLRQPSTMTWSPAEAYSLQQNPFLSSSHYSPPLPFGSFGPYHPPNAIQVTEARAFPIKTAAPAASEETVSRGHQPDGERSLNQSTISLESHLRNAWNSVKLADETAGQSSAAKVVTVGDLAPTSSKAAKDASNSEEMLAVETKLIPMANSISGAFDHARQLEAAAASSSGSAKSPRPSKFVGSRRIIDTKLLADFAKN